LQIKRERILDPGKRRNVEAEWLVVEQTRQETIPDSPALQERLAELKAVNESLWDIENEIRECEKRQDFGSRFIALARAVYQTNDRRAAIKWQINELLGANFREEKDYH
jgi:hypothetical protein